MKLLPDLQNEHGISMFFITHDTGVACKVSDRTEVIHNGRIVENAPSHHIIENPKHKYTKTLIDAVRGRKNIREM